MLLSYLNQRDNRLETTELTIGLLQKNKVWCNISALHLFLLCCQYCTLLAPSKTYPDKYLSLIFTASATKRKESTFVTHGTLLPRHRLSHGRRLLPCDSLTAEAEWWSFTSSPFDFETYFDVYVEFIWNILFVRIHAYWIKDVVFF